MMVKFKVCEFCFGEVMVWFEALLKMIVVKFHVVFFVIDFFLTNNFHVWGDILSFSHGGELICVAMVQSEVTTKTKIWKERLGEEFD